MEVYLDNWRWQGVPFYLMSGKRLAKKLTRMVIQFKEVPHSLFRQVLGPHISANRLVLEVWPREAVTLSFQTKNPGPRLCLRSADLFFDYQEGSAGLVPEAYEKALLDCIAGDQMLFWRQDAVEECWAYLDGLISSCEACQSRAASLHLYPAGSWGPPQAKELLRGRPAPWL
jgi:glucose-6-phosphate 1-dehydrogenase